MKKVCSIVLSLLLLLPNLTLANGVIGPENPNKNISRAEMATVSVRLLGLEALMDDYDKKGNFKDVKGWALPYVNLVSVKEVMMGSSKDTFNPNGKLTYVEVLTVLMRILGYEDDIDFKKYPTDYYNKALEIGLADLYIKDKEIITRSIASNTIDRALELNMKHSDLKLKDNLKTPRKVLPKEVITEEVVPKEEIPKKEVPNVEIPKKDTSIAEKISISNVRFNHSVVGLFSGQLKGSSDFTGYKVEILSKAGQVYKTTHLEKAGHFSLTGFDVDLVTKLSGYMYKVYDARGNIILSSDLQ